MSGRIATRMLMRFMLGVLSVLSAMDTQLTSIAQTPSWMVPAQVAHIVLAPPVAANTAHGDSCKAPRTADAVHAEATHGHCRCSPCRLCPRTLPMQPMQTLPTRTPPPNGQHAFKFPGSTCVRSPNL
eukprot:364165-Chlamydomonas_euryale.AAC.2